MIIQAPDSPYHTVIVLDEREALALRRLMDRTSGRQWAEKMASNDGLREDELTLLSYSLWNATRNPDRVIRLPGIDDSDRNRL